MLMLFLLSALTLGEIGRLVTHPARSPSVVAFDPGPAEATVRAFYAGMNRYLDTGDDAFLQLLAPDFQEFEGGASQGDPTALLARLDLMRQSPSPPRYTIESVRNLGSVIEVRLAGITPGDLEIAGLTVALHPSPTAVEYLSLRRNSIVARWSQDDRIPLLDHTLHTSYSPVVYNVTVVGMTLAAVALGVRQVTLDPGAELELPGAAHYAVLATEGTISTQSSAGSEQLAPDTTRLLSPPGRLRITNPGVSPSQFWLVTLEGKSAPAQDAIPTPGVTEKRLLWSLEQLLSSATSRLRLQVARVVLPPGSQVPAHRVGIAEGLLVLDGVLEATVAEHDALHCFPDESSTIVRDRVTVAAGEGLSALPDALIAYRVAGPNPVTLLVLTVAPA
jgi:hypothetical protein